MVAAAKKPARLTACCIAVLATVALLPAPSAAVPAAPVMILYRFNADLGVPYYTVEGFIASGTAKPAGYIAQGSAVIPCVVVRNGKPLTDRSGTPYVGFEVIVDAATATPADVERFSAAVRQRAELRAPNHNCTGNPRHVVDARRLFARDKPPWFDPPKSQPTAPSLAAGSPLDTMVHAFHQSPQCGEANRELTKRRAALDRAWRRFVAGRPAAERSLAERAMQLDYVMRTALYEGHIGRGCNAYGACERNVIALSIRNRALERCLSGQGCRQPGDFQGVCSEPGQYNIWDEWLTQTTGLTSCFLRPDLAATPRYAKLQAMYRQSVGDVEAILFGGEAGLRKVFPKNDPASLTSLRHYYHPPAMSPCFPSHPRIEYISAATARSGGDFVLITNSRVHVDGEQASGYRFRSTIIDRAGERDTVDFTDEYPGFAIDRRKVELRPSRRCTPYGTSTRCDHGSAGRHRKTPSWLSAGSPIRIECSVEERGEDCSAPPTRGSAAVGGYCDREMQPVAGVR